MTEHVSCLRSRSPAAQQQQQQQQPLPQQEQHCTKVSQAVAGQEQQQHSAASTPQYHETAAAGMGTQRMSELRLNSRKSIRAAQSYKGAARSPWEPQPTDYHRQQQEKQGTEAAATKDHSHWATAAAAVGDASEQRKHFQTRWQAIDGRMEFCTKRVPGSAAVEFNYEFIDRDATYHTWKKMAGGYAPQARSHLECNRFLTVQEDAQRMDALPVVKNRAPTYPNPDGPFEQRVPAKNYYTNSIYSYRIYHPSLQGALDRTLCPRPGEPTQDEHRRQKRGCSTAARLASSLQTSSLQPFATGPSPRRLHSTLVGAQQRYDHMYEILQPGAAAMTTKAAASPDFPAISQELATKCGPQYQGWSVAQPEYERQR